MRSIPCRSDRSLLLARIPSISSFPPSPSLRSPSRPYPSPLLPRPAEKSSRPHRVPLGAESARLRARPRVPYGRITRNPGPLDLSPPSPSAVTPADHVVTDRLCHFWSPALLAYVMWRAHAATSWLASGSVQVSEVQYG